MICEHCKTVLPDDAVACWKCGTPTVRANRRSVAKPPRDVLHILSAFFVAVFSFVCVGWPLPFVVVSNLPLWMGMGGPAYGIVLISTTIAFVGFAWWVAYWVITRLFSKPIAQ